MSLSRRTFFATSAAALAFNGYACAQEMPEDTYRNDVAGYGPLVEDPHGIFDLPAGFSYRVISQVGETMDDGFLAPDKFDGMGSFALGPDRVILVRNHELKVTDSNFGPQGLGRRIGGLDKSRAYDVDDNGHALPGGTTTLVYNLRTGRTESQHLSLTGTAVNCSGGVTPWGSWLSCEETTTQAGFNVGKDHGYVFEVPSRAKGLVEAVPLKALGRFRHEGACIDPRTGIVYLTEDRPDSLFYRLLPAARGDLAKGGRLQALGFTDAPESCDTRNWETVGMETAGWRDARWIDLDHVEAPDDDLRLRGARDGAAVFARGEGVFWGKDELYFTCTSGGAASAGQIMRYVPSPREGQADEKDAPGRTQLFVESVDPGVLDYADNIAVAPWGHIIACEDRYSDVERNHLKGVTPQGKVYTIGRNTFRGNAELAGVCFSPDGSTLFVNIYQPGVTLAVTGPWASFKG
ncbi:MAG: alkaline phosphatase PhoX [Pseudomonadota bacterium]